MLATHPVLVLSRLGVLQRHIASFSFTLAPLFVLLRDLALDSSQIVQQDQALEMTPHTPSRPI